MLNRTLDFLDHAKVDPPTSVQKSVYEEGTPLDRTGSRRERSKGPALRLGPQK